MAVMVYIHRFDCVYTLKGSRILRGSSVDEISFYCPGGCVGNIPYISAYQGCNLLVYACISKMYFSHWKPPGVSERMWSANLYASISGEYQTLGVHSCQPSD